MLSTARAPCVAQIRWTGIQLLLRRPLVNLSRHGLDGPGHCCYLWPSRARSAGQIRFRAGLSGQLSQAPNASEGTP
jgi:hypothetical protein